jgi:hypothetical protein
MMTPAEFERLKANPDYQGLPAEEKKKLLDDARAGRWTYTGAAPGVLEAPTDVATDPEGRVLTQPFQEQAAQTTSGPQGPLGARVEETFTPWVGRTAAKVPRIAVEGAMPTVGAITGGGIGAVTGPWTAAAGGAMGGAAGEWLNQQLGITDPSLLQMGLAGAGGASSVPTSAVMEGTVPAVRGVARAIPGRWQPGREAAVEAVQTATRGAMPSEATVTGLYSTARQLAQGAPVPTLAKTRSAINQWTSRRPVAAVAEATKKTDAIFTETEKLLQNPHSTLQEVINGFDEIGRVNEEMRRAPGQVKHLWSSLADDLEAFPTTHPGAAKIREAAKTYRQRAALLHFDEALEAIKGQARTPGGTAMKHLEQALRETRNSLPPQVYDVLEATVQEFGKYPEKPLSSAITAASTVVGGIGSLLNPAAWGLAAVPLSYRLVEEGIRGHVRNPLTRRLVHAGYQAAARAAGNTISERFEGTPGQMISP